MFSRELRARLERKNCRTGPKDAHIQRVKATLARPVVGVQIDTDIAETLPERAVVEFVPGSQKNGSIDVEYSGRFFSVFCEDLLDACTVADAVRINFS